MAEVTASVFEKDVRAAMRAASKGPVILTKRGEPSHVLLSIEDYRRLVVDARSLVEWLSVDDGVDLEPDRVRFELRVPET